MFDFLEILYDIMPPWAATPVAGTLSLIVGIIGSVWHAHETVVLTACSTPSGQFAQLFNGAAQTSCGASGLFKVLALLLMIVGYGLLAIFAIVFAVLASKGKLQRPEKTAKG